MLYHIPEYKFETLKGQIAKLNKRAAKLGVPAIKCEVKGEEMFEEWVTMTVDCHTQKGWYPLGHSFPKTAHFPNGIGLEKTGRMLRKVIADVEGQTPKFAGWTFAATIQTTTEGNLLRTAPDFEGKLDTKYRDCTPFCDHCRVNRKRNDTFIVVHDSGEQKQVGRQCIKDFLGHANPESLAKWAELMFSLSETCAGSEEEDSDCEYGGGSRQPRLISVEIFLNYVAELVLQFGFVSRKQASEKLCTSTADSALESMFPRPSKTNVIVPSEKAKELAATAREYVVTRLSDKEELSDFEHNSLVAAKCEGIELRTTGIAAYIIAYYQRETERELERAKRPTGEHFGEIKKRYKGQAFTYMGSGSTDSVYGVVWFHRFTTKEGNTAVWATGSALQVEQGKEITLDYSVKEHSEYKGQKQTYITRCKVIDTKQATV